MAAAGKPAKRSAAKHAAARSGSARAGNSGKAPAATSRSGKAGAARRGSDGKASSKSKRRLGLRGAAPWAARHAAKHAAEAEARNAEPPRPGSARATLRAPAGAEALKTRIAQLHHALQHIRALRRSFPGTFFEIAVELREIRQQELYDAKGYTSFESFVDRELDLGKAVALQLARVPDIFQEHAARSHGMDAVLAALGALDESEGASGTQTGLPAHPLKPPRGSR